jgi:hypothetical protein
MLFLFLGVEDGFSLGFGKGCLCHPIDHCISIRVLGLKCFGFAIYHNKFNIGVLYSKEIMDGIVG